VSFTNAVLILEVNTVPSKGEFPLLGSFRRTEWRPNSNT